MEFPAVAAGQMRDNESEKNGSACSNNEQHSEAAAMPKRGRPVGEDASSVDARTTAKRSRRNDAEKRRIKKIDDVVSELKVELGVGSETSKVDTLQLALAQLRQIRETTLRLQEDQRSSDTHPSSHPGLVCVSEGPILISGGDANHDSDLSGSSQRPAIPDVTGDIDIEFMDMAWLCEQAEVVTDTATSSEPGSGTGTSAATTTTTSSKPLSLTETGLQWSGYTPMSDILFFFAPLTLVATVFQIFTCNSMQSLLLCLIWVMFNFFKIEHSDFLLWVRVWRGVLYPLQSFYLSWSNIHAAAIFWPRLLMWPIGSLMFIHSVPEHAFHSIWLLFSLAVASRGDVLCVLAAAVPCAIGLVLHIVADTYKRSMCNKEKHYCTQVSAILNAVGPPVHAAVNWLRDSIVFAHPVAHMAGLSAVISLVIIVVNIVLEQQPRQLLRMLGPEGWMAASPFDPLAEGRDDVRPDGAMVMTLLIWLVLLRTSCVSTSRIDRYAREADAADVQLVLDQLREAKHMHIHYTRVCLDAY